MENPRKTQDIGRFASEGSQAAFSRIVERYVKLVYSTCFRELGHRELAEEATQAVFLALAQKAKTIRSEADLAPWLYTAARFEAKDLKRQELRRMVREERGAQLLQRLRHEQESDAWKAIEPGIDDAIMALTYADRQAILLRFFNEMSLSEVGLAMGMNEDAARMRVNRALEKLRGLLVNRKAAAISGGTLAALLTKHAIYAVPAHLPAAVAQSAGELASWRSPSLARRGLRGGSVRGGSALNPLLAKGIFIMSTNKIVAGAVAMVLLLVLLFMGVHKLRSSSATLTSSAPGGVLISGSGLGLQQNAMKLHQDCMAIMRYATENHRFPDADRWMDETAPDGADPQISGYAYNRNLSGLPYTGRGKTPRDFRLPTSAIPSPGSTILLYDSTANTKNASDTGQSISSAYRGGSNFCFVDGHVKWFAPSSINTSGPNDHNPDHPSFQP